MSHQEDVDAAIERAKSEEVSIPTDEPLDEGDWVVLNRLADDRRVLAVEVVLLREAVAGLQSDLGEVTDQLHTVSVRLLELDEKVQGALVNLDETKSLLRAERAHHAESSSPF